MSPRQPASCRRRRGPPTGPSPSPLRSTDAAVSLLRAPPAKRSKRGYRALSCPRALTETPPAPPSRVCGGGEGGSVIAPRPAPPHRRRTWAGDTGIFSLFILEPPRHPFLNSALLLFESSRFAPSNPTSNMREFESKKTLCSLGNVQHAFLKH